MVHIASKFLHLAATNMTHGGHYNTGSKLYPQILNLGFDIAKNRHRLDQVPTVHERQQVVVGEAYERIETGNLVTGGQEFYRG